MHLDYLESGANIIITASYQVINGSYIFKKHGRKLDNVHLAVRDLSMCDNFQTLMFITNKIIYTGDYPRICS